MTDTSTLKPEHLPDDFLDLLRCLYSHDVRYVIGGGYAVIYHGYSRTTGDLDIFFDPERENTERLYEALREFWGGTVPNTDSPDDLLDELGVQFGRPPNRVDLFNTLEGVDFPTAWENRVILQLEEMEVYILDKERLIACKKASDRDQDRQDIKYLTDSKE